LEAIIPVNNFEKQWGSVDNSAVNAVDKLGYLVLSY